MSQQEINEPLFEAMWVLFEGNPEAPIVVAYAHSLPGRLHGFVAGEPPAGLGLESNLDVFSVSKTMENARSQLNLEKKAYKQAPQVRGPLARPMPSEGDMTAVSQQAAVQVLQSLGAKPGEIRKPVQADVLVLVVPAGQLDPKVKAAADALMALLDDHGVVMRGANVDMSKEVGYRGGPRGVEHNGHHRLSLKAWSGFSHFDDFETAV